MSRRALVWSLSLPLLVAGTEGAHWLAYRFVYTDPFARTDALAASGHGYLSHAPTAFAVLGAVALCALLARTFSRSRTQVSLLPFVLLSPLAFTLQECGERAFAGVWPLAAVLTPTFMPGLLLQLPFALAAYLLARWLLRAADRLHAILFDRPAGLAVLPTAPRLLFAAVDLPRLGSLGAGYGERGPPALRSV
jgi:hypothetical protein